MLQQTRVDTVRPYYHRWMQSFPSIDALADADLDQVLLHWQGLGYYSRARNLHLAARLVRERHHGRLPDDPATLETLPGIGEYTAGAIASIAFGAPSPAVDGNVRRVLARLEALEDPGPARLRELATALIPARRPGDFNQALMELGAIICTPRAPRCHACPLARWCLALELGRQEELPRRRRKTAVPEETVDTAILTRPDGTTLLVRRPPHGFLGGMWEFPAHDAPTWVLDLRAAAAPIETLEPVLQVYSHRRLTYLPTLYEVPVGYPGARGDPPPGAAWASLDRLEPFALHRAQERIAAAARSHRMGRKNRAASG